MIKKYKNHSIVIAIKNAFPSHSFVFETVRRDKILKEIKNLEFIQGKKVMFQRKLWKKMLNYSQDFLHCFNVSFKVEFFSFLS